jgi:putative Holliday junction resolvase
MRWMGIDYGRKRIGIAVSDHLRYIVSPHTLVDAKPSLDAKVDQIIALPIFKEVEKIVIGLPLHMDGKESEMSAEVRLFGQKLHEKSSKPVEFFDERLSSKGVDMLLRDQQLNRKDRTAKMDTGSACLILQTYMERASFNKM